MKKQGRKAIIILITLMCFAIATTSSAKEFVIMADAGTSVQKNDASDVGKYVSCRPKKEDRLFVSDAVERKIKEVEQLLRKNPKLAWMFANCYPNTLDTTVHYSDEDGDDDTFVYTGDIHAMWLRDSGAQVWPYVRYAKEDEKLRHLIRGVILRQFKCINIDPYANAFNQTPNPEGPWMKDTGMKPELHERKYEIDSSCYPIRLAYQYWLTTGDATIFGDSWLETIENILTTFSQQQRKNGLGPYKFLRSSNRALDTMNNDGWGAPVNPVGLIASAFRPSDDATTFLFLVPSNFMAVSSLTKAAEILRKVNGNEELAMRCETMANEVKTALMKYAVYDHPKYGKIYAYEVDGFGNQLLMDDANVPSLLAMPYLGDVDQNDPIWQNTRRFVWSEDNPYFFRGSAGEGIGGPHIGHNYIWPMSIMMKAFTSDNDDETRDCIRMLMNTDGGTGFMHESFHKDDASKFTRSWFAWANTLFGELILKIIDEGKSYLLTDPMLISNDTDVPTPIYPLPTAEQVEWQKMEIYAFIHFGMNTFNDSEWGYGDASPSEFNPTKLDCEQWVRVLKEAGMKGVILTAKHHDGFCLWPSKYTDYSVANSPYKEGHGDIVGELSAACKKYGLKLGLYLSPWDRHQASYGTRLYVDYYHAQLEELMTKYGEVFEVWFDGANGGDGWYGGAKEKRSIDRRTYYDFDKAWSMVKQLQPNAIIFSDGGPGCRWVGNEKGYANCTNWSFLRINEVYPGYEHYEELPSGHADGDAWVAAECDVSIRPGWFYHKEEDNKVKSAEELVDLYYRSVGRNGTLLLNVPVTPEGLIHQKDSASLIDFHRIIQEDWKTNVLKNATVNVTDERGKAFRGKNVIDDNYDTYWATKDGVESADVTFSLPKASNINRLKIQEYIPLGQRVKKFAVEYEQDGQWLPIETSEELTTIGYCRLLRFKTVKTKKLRIRILESRGPICINEISGA